MDNYDERHQQVAERALTAKFSFWSALLTAHTVLVSVAVALVVTAIPAQKGAFKLVGYIGILCIALLLLNFAVTKSQYETIGRRLRNPDRNLSDAQRSQDLMNAHRRWCISYACELAAIVGLVIEAGVFGWLLLTL